MALFRSSGVQAIIAIFGLSRERHRRPFPRLWRSRALGTDEATAGSRAPFSVPDLGGDEPEGIVRRSPAANLT